MARQRKPSPNPAKPSPPPGFRSAPLEEEGRNFLVMSYELPEWELPDSLTVAERAVIRAVLNGATQAQIAAARAVATATVSNQIASIFRKLKVGSRMELAARLQRPSRNES